MVAGESLALDDDFVPPVNIRAIESRKNKMQIRRQRLHNRNLRRRSPHKGSHSLRSRIVGVQPCWERRVSQGLEVALHALRGPGGEELLEALGDAARLQTEGVAAEVDAFS